MISGTYELLLVVLSFVIATIASYTALELAGRVTPDLPLKARLSWIVAGAIAMGTGIWAMHFIAMLAFNLPISVTYDLKITLLSWGDAIVASGLALLLFSRAKLSIQMLFGGSVVMGLAIASMHYLGMAGMEMSQATIHYNQWLVALSVVIAILASSAALWLAFYFRNLQKSSFDWLKLSSALVMGIAISSMHYTGMWATSFIKLPESVFNLNERSSNSWLAIQIGIASFLILVATLIISLLDRRYTEQLIWQTALKESADREKALSMAIQRMRQTLDIETIFAATTSELRQVIGCDRVVVYRFNLDWSGEFVAESVADGWIALRQEQTQNPQIQENIITDNKCIFNNSLQSDNLNTTNFSVQDTYLQATQGGIYSQGVTYRVVEDIYHANFNNCYISLLEKLQAKSYVIVPIYANSKLWGLLAVYQNSAPRQWQETEINIIVQISSQLGIALEHVDLLEKTRQQSILLEQEIQERLHTEAKLFFQKQQLEETLSELKQVQSQLIQSEKMVALGQLVAGIAHEINNPLNFIFGNLNYLHQDIKNLLKVIQFYHHEYPAHSHKITEILEYADLDEINQDLQKSIGTMYKGIERIQNLVICLRNFSRLDEAEFKLVDIHEGIESTLTILQHRLQATSETPAITVVKNYDVLPLIECYPSQLNQVFMNILVNAIDALESKRQNHLLIDNCQILIDTKLLNDWIEIRISDNGLGIDENNLGKIFDPFFTTKPVGKGTGLGLSISYQIITQLHNGTLNCNSIKGEKSEFIIKIPTKIQDEISV
ncbi:GAF domain-containing protein [Tolypothrix sp. FACHB-123]|uniref:MHYT domain-containing protein n=1 Tax=Tolypothrix sp. FACHB-123 TaxID=2692868 RepID=UPI001688E335|nr:MHYT domain-containing protein [Tolypothrix sp. FACHB-123]MBD2354878.1 GAF domain-containing protein [Tolypothrix sp. FACHB-123]